MVQLLADDPLDAWHPVALSDFGVNALAARARSFL